MDGTDYEQSLTAFRKRIDKLVSARDHASAKLKEERETLETAVSHCNAVLEAQGVAQQVAVAVQQNAHNKIASVVSRCLEVVFDDPYKFKILFERKRGKTQARLVFVRDKAERDPMDGAGGGVVDVAAFALRLACLMLAKPTVRRLLVADEPFKHLSEEYVPRVRDMIETLSQEMGVQFIIVTHNKVLQIGNVVELE